MLLLALAAAAAAMVIPLNRQSVVLRRLKRCAVAGILAIVGLEFAIALLYLLYPSYLNHVEVANAAVSCLGWEGYPLYPRLDIGDVCGLQYGPVFYQVTGFFMWLLHPSIAASKIPGLIAFALSHAVSLVTLRRTGADVAEALTMTAVQCFILAGFTDQGFVSGVRPDAFLFFASQTAVLHHFIPQSTASRGHDPDVAADCPRLSNPHSSSVPRRSTHAGPRFPPSRVIRRLPSEPAALPGDGQASDNS